MCYFAYIIPVWINSPKASHSEVWTGFANEGGWSSMGLAVLVGQLSGIGMQTGVDTVSKALSTTAWAATNQLLGRAYG
jgi:choline transport protein